MKRKRGLKISLLFIFLTSCRQDNTQLAKDEFSKYFNGKDEVVLKVGDFLYFEKVTLNLSKLIDNNEFNSGVIIKNDSVIFSTSQNDSMFNHTLNIYESNLQGTEIKQIFSKGGYRTVPVTYAVDDVFYIEHYSNHKFDFNSRIVDKYTLSTQRYENVAKGKDCSLSDYRQRETQNRYEIEIVENKSPQEHGKFIISDLLNKVEVTIDDDYLKKTEYISSMEIFNYGPKMFEISKGHILIAYGIAAGDGWTNPLLVFEYDFSTNTLDYKLLAFPYDIVVVDLLYIG